MKCVANSESEWYWVVEIHFVSPWYNPFWLTGLKSSSIYLWMHFEILTFFTEIIHLWTWTFCWIVWSTIMHQFMTAATESVHYSYWVKLFFLIWFPFVPFLLNVSCSSTCFVTCFFNTTVVAFDCKGNVTELNPGMLFWWNWNMILIWKFFVILVYVFIYLRNICWLIFASMGIYTHEHDMYNLFSLLLANSKCRVQNCLQWVFQ